jgi:phage baseplate assembly protein W
MSELDFPFHLDERGHTAGTSYEEHVRDMIEQLLLTSPGERVNRPDYGSGLLQMVFAPSSPEVAAALQFSIQAALQRWLGDVIETRDLTVEAEDAQLRVTVEYALRQTGEVQTATFEGGAAS